MSFFRTIILMFTLFFVYFSQAASVTTYLPENHTYNKIVPTPKSIIGFGLGDRHVRYDQLLNYFEALDDSSKRLKITSMGQTHQLRNQILVTISSEKNIENLSSILNSRDNLSSKNNDEPLVIWLGYSVHGDELSGANAAMVVAYYLAASEDKKVKAWLDNTVIVLEPSINPDGMDRFASWVSDNRGTAPNADPNHIEHHQDWRTGRSNHFGFDLNRDWLPLSQIETKNRMAYFQRYQPHVVGDFHEMVSDNSYFFQPGVATRNNPLTPKNNIKLTHLLATYHAKALDKENRLYFSEENFDDFYYGKGSTYPDINGSVGVLFEQATSRGMQTDTINGLLTFEYGIKNHVLTSLSTIEGAWSNKEQFIEHRKTFYKNAKKQAKKENFSGYIITEKNDHYRLNAFLDKLKQHKIEVYGLTENFKFKSKEFSPSYSYYIPLEQPKYKVIKALFDTPKEFKDNTFYDVSGWTLPLAMNIEYHQVDSTWGLELSKNAWDFKTEEHPITQTENDYNAYAYAFEWHDFLAPKLLNQLQQNNIKTKVTTKNFTIKVAGKEREFKAGTIIIPTNIQTQNYWQKQTINIAQENNIELVALSSGYTSQGVDFGSPSLKIIPPVKVLMIGGKGVSEWEAAEVKFYLDDTQHIPLTVVEKDRLGVIDFNTYTHIVMVDGNYQSLNPSVVIKLESWLKLGGVVFAQKHAAKWLAEKDILRASFVSNNQLRQLFDSSNLSYEDKSDLAARQRIAGAIYETQLDITHPLAFGFSKKTLPVFRNNTLIMEPLHYPFTNVGTYSVEPLLSGYTDKNLIKRIANTSSLVAHNVGKGRVIATTDNLAFRGYWYGSVKILANSIFFGKVFNAPATR
ncbi:M14 family zinc carboxypeptidase [Colwellia sp. RE-S-Sl-9]